MKQGGRQAGRQVTKANPNHAHRPRPAPCDAANVLTAPKSCPHIPSPLTHPPTTTQPWPPLPAPCDAANVLADAQADAAGHAEVPHKTQVAAVGWLVLGGGDDLLGEIHMHGAAEHTCRHGKHDGKLGMAHPPQPQQPGRNRQCNTERQQGGKTSQCRAHPPMTGKGRYWTS